MAACGHTIAQLPHWMQTSGFHTGTVSEMLRFSQRAVAGRVGAVRRQRADWQLVAAPGHHHGRHLSDERPARAPARRAGGSRVLVAAAGSGTSEGCSSAAIDGGEILLDELASLCGRMSPGSRP